MPSCTVMHKTRKIPCLFSFLNPQGHSDCAMSLQNFLTISATHNTNHITKTNPPTDPLNPPNSPFDASTGPCVTVSGSSEPGRLRGPAISLAPKGVRSWCLQLIIGVWDGRMESSTGWPAWILSPCFPPSESLCARDFDGEMSHSAGPAYTLSQPCLCLPALHFSRNVASDFSLCLADFDRLG
ncbi:hypothetical protein BDV06DRAFT_141400 [Aspergillus oleicola]